MRPLRLTPAGQGKLADFTRDTGNHERLDALTRAFADGTWLTRFWHQPYATNPDVLEIRPDTHLHVFVVIALDETDGRECVDIMTIHDSSHG